ncbi:MAG: hypothetical protein Q8M06_09820 [Methanobacteriaceae archaeon]|nr:hypothetical protein [Methanobacteriaceae archaeon]
MKLVDYLKLFFKNTKKMNEEKKTDLFTLWISNDDSLPELQQLSLKSLVLTGHDVNLYVYGKLDNVPSGISVNDANKVLDESNIFTYKSGFNKGSYSGFANWFRTKRLYEKGGSWADCDILAIKNIKSFKGNTLISSQIYDDGTIGPNNGFLRFKKEDILIKSLLDYMAKIKDNVRHGDTGPVLLKSMIQEKYQEYSNFLTNPNFISPINFFEYENYLKPSHEIVPKLKIDEIWGFHVWNAMLNSNGIIMEKINSGFYFDLKEIILNSKRSNYDERINSFFEQYSK